MESEEAFRDTVFDLANDIAFVLTDLDGFDAKILDFSAGAEAIFGYRRAEVIGVPFNRLFPLEDKVKIIKLLQSTVLKQSGLTKEIVLKRKSGEAFPALYTKYLIKNHRGGSPAALNVAVDISRRKRIEDSIRYAYSEMRQLFDAAVDGMRVIDRDFNMLRVSESFARLSGVTKDQAVKRKCYEILRGSLCNTPLCPLKQIFDGESYVEYEVEKEGCDGRRIPCLLTATPFRAPDGELIGIVEHFKDVTARQRAFSALRRSEEKYATVVENSLTGIYIEVDGTIEFVNERLSEIFGCRKAELIGRKTHTFIHPDYHSHVAIIRNKLLAREIESSEFEARCLTPGRRTIWVNMRDTRIDFHGRSAILGNLVEITQRKHMEDALRDSEKTLKILSSHLFTAQEDERKRLAHDLHDIIGQTLSAIKFCADNLAQPNPAMTADQRNILVEKVVTLTQYAIDEVRRYSMELRPSTLDDLGIVATIQWFCREFQSIYGTIRINQEMEVEEDEIPASIKTVIFRVVQEALNNVAKHARADRVRISLRKTETHIELVVEDNGIGFDLQESHTPRGLLKGFGIAGMRERVEFAGGVFIVLAMKGTGTFIRARWPAHA